MLFVVVDVLMPLMRVDNHEKFSFVWFLLCVPKGPMAAASASLRLFFDGSRSVYHGYVHGNQTMGGKWKIVPGVY